MRLQTAVLLMLAVALTSCESKKRFTTAYSNFTVAPAAVTVAKDTPVTLTAVTGGSSDPNPVWEVVPANAGSFSPSIGKTVVFTPSTLGDAIVYATSDGQQAQAQVAIVSFIPTANTFSVYTDAGLPLESGISSDIFVGGTMTLETPERTDGYTPEGIKYQRATGNDTPTIGFWGVTLDAGNVNLSKDLAAFATGSLRFSIRLARPLTVGETLQVEIDDINGGPGTGGSVNLNTTTFSGLSTDWQDVSVPIGSFAPGQVLGQIKVPFAISLQNVSSPLTFDIDAIRWQK